MCTLTASLVSNKANKESCFISAPKEELTSDSVAASPAAKQPNISWAWRPPATRAVRAKGSGHPAIEPISISL